MNLFLCMVLESGAILWDWALNLWDLTLPPGSHYQNKLNCRTPGSIWALLGAGKKSCTFGDQKCQKCCECDSLVRVNEKHKERKTGLFYLKWKHSGSKKYIHKNRSDEVITDNLSQKDSGTRILFSGLQLQQWSCPSPLSGFPFVSTSQFQPEADVLLSQLRCGRRGPERDWDDSPLTFQHVTNEEDTSRKVKQMSGSPPTPELKQPHWTPQAPKTKPLLVRLSLLSPSNPSSQVPESSSTLSHSAGLRCIWIHISNGRSKQPPSFDVYMA